MRCKKCNNNFKSTYRGQKYCGKNGCKKKNRYYSRGYNKKKEEAKKFYHEWKLEKGCCRCGYNVCPTALVFHHPKEKDKNISINYIKFFNRDDELISDLDKCILLCSNCHREIHYNKNNDIWYNEDIELLENREEYF